MKSKSVKCSASFTTDGKDGTIYTPIIDAIKKINDETSTKDIMASMLGAMSEMLEVNGKDQNECDNPHTMHIEMEFIPNSSCKTED